MRYDLVVIGNTAAAEATALAAARLQRRVAWIETPTGGLSGLSRSPVTAARRLREAAIDFARRQLDSRSAANERMLITPQRLAVIAQADEARERESLMQRVARWQIDLIAGDPQIVEPHTVVVQRGAWRRELAAGFIVIATGTHCTRTSTLSFEGERVLCADDVPNMSTVPHSLLIVGASTTGIEYALLFALLGTRVTLVDRGDGLSSANACSGGPSLLRQAQGLGVRLLPRSEVIGVDSTAARTVRVELLSGEALSAERVLFTTERNGATRGLGLEALGIQPDERGRLWCDDELRTWNPQVLGVGDVVGHPHIHAVSVDAPRKLVWNLLGSDTALTSRPRNSAPGHAVSQPELE